MAHADAGTDNVKSPFGFDRYEIIGVDDILEGEEVLLMMGPEKSGKTNFIRALYLASDTRSSNGSFDRPASKPRQRTVDDASNARYKITEAHRLHSKHLPEIESGIGERKQIESVVVLECSSQYYSSADPQSYDPLLDFLRQKRCRVGVLICGNIISGSPAPSQELVDRLSDRTDLQNLTLVETNWDRATIWRGWKDSAYHTRMVEGAWKDLVAFTHTSIAQYDNKKSPALDAWRIVFNTLRTDLKGSDIVILIMGPTGAGKSSFIRAATGLPDVKVGYGLKSETQWVTAWTSKKTEGGRRVVYIDTPGFDDTAVADSEMLERIATWLHQNLTNSIPISGILYFHRISDNRMSGSAVQNLEIFQKLCGYKDSDFAQRIRFVTTMWDEVQPSDGERRLDELCKTWWAKMLNKGAQHCGLRRKDEPSIEAVKAITNAVINNSNLPGSLSTPHDDRIQTEFILIVGPSRSGKSAFIRAATGQSNVEVGDGLKPKTETVIAWTAKNTEAGRRVVYIDTPGFDKTSTRDDEIVKKIADWLGESRTDTLSISAILYFHRIDDVAETKTDRASVQRLELLQQHCALKESQFYPRVFLITTMWDVVDPSTGNRHLEELREGRWAEVIEKGARECALRQRGGAEGPSVDSVKDVVQSVVQSASNTSSKTLNSSRTAIQGELQQGKEALNTAAADVLYKQTGTQKKRLREIVTKLEAEEAAITDDDTLKAMLKKELDDALQELALVEKQKAQLVKGGARSIRLKFLGLKR